MWSSFPEVIGSIFLRIILYLFKIYIIMGKNAFEKIQTGDLAKATRPMKPFRYLLAAGLCIIIVY
jgi:hypothetical protein